jgi:hypothetical protein
MCVCVRMREFKHEVYYEAEDSNTVLHIAILHGDNHLQNILSLSQDLN